MNDKIDLILDEIKSLKAGQQRNYDLIQKNGIIIEKVASDVKALAENQGVLSDKIDNVDTKLSNQIKANDDNLKQAYKMLSHDIQQVDRKLDIHIAQPA